MAFLSRQRRTEEVGCLLPELYLHGLAHGDFDLALRGRGVVYVDGVREQRGNEEAAA